MSKPHQPKVIGNCLCSCKKSNAITNSGDNYNSMPTKLSRLDSNEFWAINSKMMYFNSQTDGSRVSNYTTGAEGPSRISNTYMWPNIIDKFYNVLGYNTLQSGTYGIHWKNIIEGSSNQYLGGHINDEDSREIKSTIDVENGNGTNYIFIPIYSETPEINNDRAVTIETEYARIGRYFPDAFNLAAALPDLYEEYIDIITAIGTNHGDILAWINSIEGLPSCPKYCIIDDGINISSILCGLNHYVGPTDISVGSFSWWINWTIGKETYPSGPMDNLTVDGFLCGWIVKPKFLYYVYELLLNNTVDYGQDVYTEIKNVPDTSYYGYLIDISENTIIDRNFFNSARKAKISKSTTQHIVDVEDSRDYKWIAGINSLTRITPIIESIDFPYPGMFFTVTTPTTEERTICTVDRSAYNIADNITELNELYRTKFAGLMDFSLVKLRLNGEEYTALQTETFPCSYDAPNGGIIGGAFDTYEYKIEETEFYDDIVKISNDGKLLYVPNLIGTTTVREEGKYDIIRSVPKIYNEIVITDITSNFVGSDIYNETIGTNNWGSGIYNFHANSGEYSTYDYFNSYDVRQDNINAYRTIANTPYYKPMVGPPTRFGNMYLKDSETKEIITCDYKQHEKLLNVCLAQGEVGGLFKLHGWTDDNTLLYCPFNYVNKCVPWIDANNIREGRAADNLVFSDINITDATVYDIPIFKILKTGYEEILLSDYQDMVNKDLYDLTGVLSTYCVFTDPPGTSDRFYRVTIVEDTPSVSPSIFPTAEEFYERFNTILSEYSPIYLADDDGLSTETMLFLDFDYMKKYSLFQSYTNIGTNPFIPIIVLDTNQQVIGKFRRTFKGVEKSKCNDENFHIDGVRGFTIDDVWFDDILDVTTSPYSLTIKRLVEYSGEDDFRMYWKSLNNLVSIPSIETTIAPFSNYNFLLNLYFDIVIEEHEDVTLGRARLRIESIYGDNVTECITCNDICYNSNNGFTFSLDFPIRTKNEFDVITLQYQPLTFYVKPQQIYTSNLLVGNTEVSFTGN